MTTVECHNCGCPVQRGKTCACGALASGNRGYPAADDAAAEPSTNGFYVGALTVETVVGIVAGFFFGVMLTSFCWLVIR